MLAKDVMTVGRLAIRDDASLSDAITLMLDHRVSGLPVVDEAGCLVGILTEGDLLRRTETGTARTHPGWLDFVLGPGRLAVAYVRQNSRRVKDLMTPDVVTVDAHTPVDDVVELMESKRIRRVPVMEGKTIIGVLSRSDLLRPLRDALTKAEQVDSATDQEIHDRILTEFGRQPWAPVSGITIGVADGIVILEGTILDERDRTALKVVAENVPGVKGVRDALTWIEPMSGAPIGPMT